MSLTKIGSIGINTGIQLAGVTTVSTLKVGSGVTLSSDGDIFALGISTVSTLKVGSGVTLSSDGDIFAVGVSTFADGVKVVGGSSSSDLTVITSNNNVGVFSGTNNGANIQLFDDDTESKIRTVDGRLHLSADDRDEVADSEIRFIVDNNIKGFISAGSSFSLGNDSDTFIGHPSSNTLTVTTQGSERVRIETGGNVGVGTNNATSLLHVHGSGGGTSGLKISNTFKSVSHYFQNDNDNSNYIISYAGTGSPEIELKSNGFVSINGTGKKGVGVGVGASHRDAAFTVAANVAGVSTALALLNENGSSTGTEILTNKNLILSADPGDDSGTSTSNIIFKVDAAEQARIESNGKLLLGSNLIRNIGGNTSSGQLQIEGTGGNNASMQLIRNSADTGSSLIRFGKTRGTTTGAAQVTSVASGDHLGHITFNAADGTDVNNTVALIRATVNGTVAENQIPTDLVFETSASSGGNRAERIRIKSDGKVGVGTEFPKCKLHVAQGKSGFDYGTVGNLIVENSVNTVAQILSPNSYSSSVHFGDQDNGMVGRIQYEHIHNSMRFWTSNNERMVIASGGNVGIGTTNPAGTLHVSSGASGDCLLILEADTDDGNEGDNPAIIFRQDGGKEESAILQENNELVIANSVNSNGAIIFKTGSTTGYTNATEALRITDNGDVLINQDVELAQTVCAVDGNTGQRNSATGTGAYVKTFVLSRSYLQSTSGTNVLTFDNFGTSAFDITVFRRDTVAPAGAAVTKLYLAFHGSGLNITQATLVQEDKVIRGNIHGVTYSITENNDTATLVATGDNTGGESQNLIFHILSHGNSSGNITVAS